MIIEAMKQVLEAWQTSVYGSDRHHKAMLMAMTNMGQVIAEAEKQEPVAWMDEYGRLLKYVDPVCPTDTPLYIHPQPKRYVATPREPLKDEQFQTIRNSLSRQDGWDGDGWDLALKEAIEAAHGIKENT